MPDGGRSAPARAAAGMRLRERLRLARRRAVTGTSPKQAVMFLAATAVCVAMVVVAQSSLARTGRQQRSAILVETVRAEALQLDSLRAQTFAGALLRHERRFTIDPKTLLAGEGIWLALRRTVRELAGLEPALAAELRADAINVFEHGLLLLDHTPGPLLSTRLRTVGSAFAAAVGHLNGDAQRAGAREQRLADSAASSAERAFIGSFALGLLLLLLIGQRLHRLRRLVAVEAARRTSEDRGEARLRALLEHSSDIVTVVAPDLTVRWQADSISRRLGHGTESLIGRPLATIAHPDDEEAVEQFLTVGLARTGSRALTFRAGHGDGSWRTIEAVANNRVGDPEIDGLVVSMRDATERKALEDQLRHHAYHDSLTGLANRSMFENRVAQAVAIATRSGRRFGVLFIDLDDFKTINDSLGHVHGDELLCMVAARILGILRASDTAARLGGDEFAVLLELPADAGEAERVAERILEALSCPFSIGERELRVTASLGVALTSDADGVQELMRNADIAMYAAKADGKHAVRTFEPEMHRLAVERLELTGELQAAIDAEQFVLEYQPIVELGSLETVGIEALVRWQRPGGGRVSPDTFIGLCEDTGLIVPLGRWILEAACAQVQQWRLAHPLRDLHVSVNVSTRQLAEPEFVDSVAAVLAQSGLPPQALTLEITESVMIGDREDAIARLRALRAFGVRIALDDFGTGYSSLAHLRELPVDTLKIDRSFIDGIERDPEQAMLVRGILDLGASLQLTVVAEGIESPEQVSVLVGPHRPLAQGYLFHRPMAPQQIEALLDAEPARPVSRAA